MGHALPRLLLLAAVLAQALWGSAGLSLPGLPIKRAVIDLRSDTVTRPSPAMRIAMFEAEVGDDVFGDDPSVLALEKRAAGLFGKEASLFFPSGTMANLAATMSWCTTRGSEMLLGDTSHMFLYEQGGAAQLAGVASRVVSNKRDGTMNIDALESSLRADNIHFPVTELICLENTHNFCGGRILPDGYTEAVSWMAQKRGIPLHIDGARIWNAATATKQPVAALARHADSISACLSKGLGAPVGSVLVGSTKFIAKARRARKALGGGMRQVGILAAAASVALDDFEAGVLEPSHAQAKILAKALREMPGFGIDLDAVETNIILVHIDDDSPATPEVLADMVREKGILVLAFGPKTLRLVTHRDISNDDIVYIIDAFHEVSKGMWPRPKVTKEAAAPSTGLFGLLDEGMSFFGPSRQNLSVVSSVPGSDEIANDLQTTAKRSSSLPVTGKEIREIAPSVEILVDGSPSVNMANRPDEPPSILQLLIPATSAPALSPPTGAEALLPPDKIRMMEVMINQASARDAWEQQALKENVGAKAYTDYDQLSDVNTSTDTQGSVGGRGITELEANESDKEYYEEAVVHGMSVSSEGFCVFLRGAVCDRVLRVHVTPSDPMADGLDSEQVETPEAVTLLQLLQGIDVESHLSRDALTIKFAEAMQQESSMMVEGVVDTGGADKDAVSIAVALGKGSNIKEPTENPLPLSSIIPSLPSIALDVSMGKNSIVIGASASSVVEAVPSNSTESVEIKPQQLVLRRVMVTEVTKPKKFKARLCGCVRRQDPLQADGSETFSSVDVGLSSAAVPAALAAPAASALPFSSHGTLIAPTIDGNFPGSSGMEPAQEAPFPAPVGFADALDPWIAANYVTSEKICARVDVQSAFEAIALALRHSAVIEVKSSLLQDPDFSYTIDELKNEFPKLLEADINFDTNRPRSEDFDSRNEVSQNKIHPRQSLSPLTPPLLHFTSRRWRDCSGSSSKLCDKETSSRLAISSDSLNFIRTSRVGQYCLLKEVCHEVRARNCRILSPRVYRSVFPDLKTLYFQTNIFVSSTTNRYEPRMAPYFVFISLPFPLSPHRLPSQLRQSASG